jgi:SAM-dependent methyltransferase
MSGWVDVACALCGSLQRVERFREGRWTVMACGGCRLVYVTPRFDDDELIGRVYDPTYWRSPTPRERGYGDYRRDHDLLRRTFARRLAALDGRLPARGRALDVGCATGAFLELARERGFEVHGVEPSPTAHAEAAERLGPERVYAGTLEEAELAPASFDLITFWDVLGHLPRPVRTLEQARRLLAPGGRLVVETQDVQSLAARFLGRRWQHYKHAEHLVHFDRDTLARALFAAGLQLEFRTRRAAGKYVRGEFLAERARRLCPALAPLCAPLARLPGAIYVNPLDEWIAVARGRAA